MSKHDSTTQTMTIAEVITALSDIASQGSRNEVRVLVENAGEPVAALVSADDLRRLNDLDHAWDERTNAIKRFSQAFADVSVEEGEAEIARILDEGRRRRSAEAERQPA